MTTFSDYLQEKRKDLINEDLQEITTGKPVSLFYSRNLKSSKKFEPSTDVGRNLEPHGEYMNVDHKTPLKSVDNNWETGKITFKNPLVLDRPDKIICGVGWIE